MKAVILAGGKGTRLQPYSTILPKPLMPVDEYPILEIIIKQLKKYGFNEIIITIGHLGQLIETYFGNGRKYGVKIRYSLEDKILGTAGPLSLIDNLSNDFLVMNGDILTSLNYNDIFKYHIIHNSYATIAMYNKIIRSSLGVLRVNDNNELINYDEKPTFRYDVSMGIYIINKKALKFIKRYDYIDFPDFIKILINNDRLVKCYRFKGLWLDIGTPEDYALSKSIFPKKKKLLL